MTMRKGTNTVGLPVDPNSTTLLFLETALCYTTQTGFKLLISLRD